MGLALGSAAFAYILIDVFVGWLVINPLSPPVVPDPVVHHTLEPNTYSRIQTPEFDYVQRVNNLGLRGLDVEVRKPEGVLRILTLGDSFTLGTGVEDDETASHLLESKLNAKGAHVQVVNGGVDSYSPILAHLRLTRRLAELEPDLVILLFDMGDLVQEQAYRAVATLGPDGDIVAIDGRRRRTLGNRLRSFANHHLILTRLILYYASRALSPPGPMDVVTTANRETLAHTLASDHQNRDAQWEAVFESIRATRAFCDGIGADLLLVLYPCGHQVGEDEWAVGRRLFVPEGAEISDRSVDRLLDFAQTSGIRVLNTFPAFRAYDGDSPLYYERDLHWTPAGQRLLADELERHLTESVATGG